MGIGRVALVTIMGTFKLLSCYLIKNICSMEPSHKSHNASDEYPTMHHFVTEMCTRVHISVTKWCIVGYWTNALWDLCDKSIEVRVPNPSMHSSDITQKGCRDSSLHNGRQVTRPPGIYIL